MNLLTLGKQWGSKYPGAVVGIMTLKRAANPKSNKALENRRRDLESLLRDQYSTKSDFGTSPILQAYSSYYKSFKKTYPVLLQLHSVALKGKSIPNFNCLVEAMFIAELQNMLLTAGHDLDHVDLPLTLNIASGDESYILLNGKHQTLKQGDMMMSDSKGVISSVIYGPDNRTMISNTTKNLLFVVYTPNGVGEERVQSHLEDIRNTIALFSENLESGQIECAIS